MSFGKELIREYNLLQQKMNSEIFHTLFLPRVDPCSGFCINSTDQIKYHNLGYGYLFPINGLFDFWCRNTVHSENKNLIEKKV